ncbi:hypothetical protein UA38_11665 [Photobacterium kishitanii]|uniref:Uncharacterized protein n=1 Tax=Photobacterium kishitanii TaxID=318456 RepID=A0AAX0YSY0_9GAMM|nr:hypothetical protein [Photobacterium kishitanii]KJG57027.1 hypothetical protein UA38_11665 [Photobacterium kishitanii]OBU31228.1 hypothetical protein AYY23_20155 [Photobacterium kishitanii]PSW46864.1 hypothetical protein C0W66_20995 [Photobacterium kishitanii]PSX18356.1 hypothetical protein C0W70_15925 [Photobacterium kishitanii]PSX26857.1 hypothetical protein C0W52_16860 [Photobacterium kishitanii]
MYDSRTCESTIQQTSHSKCWQSYFKTKKDKSHKAITSTAIIRPNRFNGNGIDNFSSITPCLYNPFTDDSTVNRMDLDYAKSFLTFIANQGLVELAEVRNALHGDVHDFNKCLQSFSIYAARRISVTKTEVFDFIRPILIGLSIEKLEVDSLLSDNSCLDLDAGFCYSNDDRFGEESEKLAYRVWCGAMPTKIELNIQTLVDEQFLAKLIIKYIDNAAINALFLPPSYFTERTLEQNEEFEEVIEFLVKLNDKEFDSLIKNIASSDDDFSVEELTQITDQLSEKPTTTLLNQLIELIRDYGCEPIEDCYIATKYHDMYEVDDDKLEENVSVIMSSKNSHKVIKFIQQIINSQYGWVLKKSFNTDGQNEQYSGYDTATFRGVTFSHCHFQNSCFEEHAENIYQDTQDEALGIDATEDGISMLCRIATAELILLAFDLLCYE